MVFSALTIGQLPILGFSHTPSLPSSIASTLSTRLQQNSRQPFQFSVAQVNLKSTGVQCRSAKQRLRALVSIHNRTTNDLPFELNFSSCNVPGDGFPIRKYVLAAAPRFESDRFEVSPRHERIERAGIDEEFAGPTSLRVRRIADGYVNMNCTHYGSPSELVLLLSCLK